MKIKFDVTITRAEWKRVQDQMCALMTQLQTHLPSLEASGKADLKTSMLRYLNRIPGITIKSKSLFGSMVYAAGLKDDITLELEIETNEHTIDTTFDLANVMADVAGPFLNAVMIVSKGTALKELKHGYAMFTHKSKPTEYSVVRTTDKFEVK